jgi:hypothetical protein
LFCHLGPLVDCRQAQLRDAPKRNQSIR